MGEILTSTIAMPSGPVEFTFDRLPVTSDVLYAVYCNYEGRHYCFHMAYDTEETTDFKVIDKRNCPYVIHELQYLLSRAIEHHHL